MKRVSVERLRAGDTFCYVPTHAESSGWRLFAIVLRRVGNAIYPLSNDYGRFALNGILRGDAGTFYALQESDGIDLVALKRRYVDYREAVRLQDLVPNVTRHVHSTGCDPEFFLQDEAGEIVSAFKLLPSSNSPIKICGVGAIFNDGIQAETAITSGGCHEGVITRVGRAIQEILRRAEAKFKKPLSISPRTVLVLDSNSRVGKSKLELQLGCSPSLNAYKEVRQPLDGDTVQVRSAGGHLHYGLQDAAALSRAIPIVDTGLALPWVSLAEGVDSPERRRYYGRAGEYRRPPHGVEYRTLSNFWTFHPFLTYLTLDLGRLLINGGLSRLSYDNAFRFGSTKARVIINETDVVGARKLLDENRSIYLSMFGRLYGHDVAKDIFNIVYEGARNIMPLDDIRHNWRPATTRYPWHVARRLRQLQQSSNIQW